MSRKSIGGEARSHGKFVIFVALFVFLYAGLSPFKPIVAWFTAVLTISGFLLLKKSKLGIIAELVLSIAVFIFFIATGSPDQWWKWLAAGVIALSFWIESKRYLPILKGTKTWDDVDWLSEEEEDEENKALISIVLLQRQSRSLDTEILKQVLSEAWGGTFDDESEDQFVTGEDPIHFVKSQQGMWLIHNHPQPYGPPKDMAESVPELRLRTALAEHRAWMAVDLMMPENEELPLETYYPYIFRLIKDLANEDTLVIYRPESGSANIWNEEVAASLGSDDPLQSFSQPTNPSVLQVADDDPRMLAAVKEARDTFHLYREHWEKRTDENYFSVKAAITREGHTEFIWVDATGLEPNFIHGTLGNEPVNLPGLSLGSQVEIPLSDLNDWAVMIDDDSPPLGLYTVKVLQNAHSQDS